jgi:carbonic anhydrase/acetyltransferase-like protein (isoleucine patch superfamily)
MIRTLNGKSPRIDPSAWVSEAAYVIGDVEIGPDSTVWPGAVIRADFSSVRIGRNTHVEDNSVLHAVRPMVIGDNVTIGHGVVMHGARVGNSVLLANKSVILNDAEIDDFCVISSGSVVPARTKVPSMSFVEGVPGTIMGELRPNQVERVRNGGPHHTRMAAQYREQGL